MEKKTFKAIQVQKDRSLKLVDLEFPPVGDNEVLIQIKAAGLSPADVSIVKGQFVVGVEPPHGLGFEAAGIISEVGKNLTSRFKVGDRVCLGNSSFKIGVWAEYTVIDGDNVFPIHPENSFEDAAYHFSNPFTVLAMLDEVKKEGHKAIIQSAASSALAKIFIRVLKENGIKSINLVRRDDVKDELIKLGADYVLNTQSPDFERELEEIAKRENATKFYDAVGGELLVKVLRKMPFGSRASVYGLLGGDTNIPVTSYDLFGGKALEGFSFFMVYSRLSYEEKLKMSETVQEKLKTTFKTTIAKTFSLAEIDRVIEHSEKYATEGKPLIKP